MAKGLKGQFMTHWSFTTNATSAKFSQSIARISYPILVSSPSHHPNICPHFTIVASKRQAVSPTADILQEFWNPYAPKSKIHKIESNKVKDNVSLKEQFYNVAKKTKSEDQESSRKQQRLTKISMREKTDDESKLAETQWGAWGN